ncbi:30S ribosomal protein S6--L-glutamate ligase [Asticcacaulis endophyticus]|uniref:Alpha-L-glutamate ligase n=1 Tax=Asticcacaulis endophyticus TaxID=1395890 RepID=A0A918PTL7_9CAUL|nr:30S ribosomal protein S6--L-glutamate ligase [Asticcacaulis endophyticus]GGZ20112.1 alpha-L-glutamate ligase [Asticcacaulis endophyticus]
MTDAAQNAPLTFGWEEWLGLPDLGLPAIKAKVDTGARTSSLHAVDIEPFGTQSKPRVRFVVNPIAGRHDVEVVCSADIIGQREVTSSNGETEMRYFIETRLDVKGRLIPIEVSLTNREGMAYRMLLGRQALESMGALVDPVRSQILPPRSYDAYSGTETPAVRRPLRIALLTQAASNYSSRAIIEAAQSRDHVIEAITTSRCYMNINVLRPEVHYDGKPLPQFDVVIPRIGVPMTSYGLAVVRQFETTGAYCLNRSNAIAASRDKLHALQVLARKGIPMPVTAFAKSPKDTDYVVDLVGGAPLVVKLTKGAQGRGVVLADTRLAASSVISAFRDLDAELLTQEFIKEADGEDLRCFVIGHKVVAAMMRRAKIGDFRANLHQGGDALSVDISLEEAQIAVKAARALGLQVAGVDILRSKTGPKVLEVNSSPGLQGIEKASGVKVADLIIGHIEGRMRPIQRLGAKSPRLLRRE